MAIKDMGLNAVRVPFGYWIVLGAGAGEPYEAGGQVKVESGLLSRALRWSIWTWRCNGPRNVTWRCL